MAVPTTIRALRRGRAPLARAAAVLAVSALVGAGCGGDGEASDVAAGASGGAGTTGGAAGATGTDGAAAEGDALVTCENPEGFRVAAPASWSTNGGEVVPPCSMFDREPFTVPEGTDERVAAITAFVDPVDLATATGPREGRDADRAVTAVDGRRAVRLSYETTGEGLYPEGTPVTTYAVDVTPSGGDPATLFLDTVGIGGFDHDANVAVLDRMARTLEIVDPEVDTDTSVVATSRGGGGGFSVTASTGGTGGSEVCLRIPPEGERRCVERPGDDRVHTVALSDLGREVQAGVTGDGVWRVDLVTADGERHSYVPAPVPDADVRAYAFHDSVGSFQRLVLVGAGGEELRTVPRGEA